MRAAVPRVPTLFLLLLAFLVPLRLPAQGAERLFEAGRSAFRDGMYVMAGRNFQQLTEQYPENPLADDAEYLHAVADFYLGEFESCIAILKGYARKYPRSDNNARVSYWLGSAYFQLLDYDRALRSLQSQVDNHPEEQPYHDHSLMLKGMVEENLSRWSAAQGSYTSLLKRDSARDLWPEALFRSGGIHLRQSAYGAALTAFSRILVEFPASRYAGEALFFAAECSFFLGRHGEAERRFNTVLQSEPTQEQRQTSLYRLALILSQQGRGEEALRLCLQLERRFPDSRYREPLARLKADLLFDLGRYGEAYAAYKTALAVSSDREERQVILYNTGLSAYLDGRLRDSIEPLEQALGGRTEIAEQSLFRLAAVQAELGQRPQAAERFVEFRERFPRSERREEATRMLAALYFDAAQHTQALALYTELITRYPDSRHGDEYLFKRGSVQLQSGALAPALKDFHRMTERWPQSPFAAESTYNIGYIYSRRGEYLRATPYFREALDSTPSEELAGRAILAAGVCAFNAGEYAEAAEWFRRNTSAGGEDPGADRRDQDWTAESWLYLGRTYYRLEQLERAAQTFATAAAWLRSPRQAEEALFWKGLSEFRLERYSTSESTFLELARRYPQGQRTAESYYRAGICAAQADRGQESIDHFQRALEILADGAGAAPEGRYLENLHQEILFQKGLSHLQLGERRLALQSYETLNQRYPQSNLTSEAFFKVAEQDFRLGNYQGAARAFLTLKERFPESPAADTALYWAGLSASRNGERSTALRHLIAFLEETGGDGSRSRSDTATADLAMREIRALLAGIEESEARIFEDFHDRVKSSPALDPQFRNRIRLEYALYIFDEDPETAVAIAGEIRAEDPDEPLSSEVDLLIAEYYRDGGELGRAKDVFTGIVAANSGRPGAAAQLGIGRVLEAEQRNQEAAEEYLKVHFLYPDQADLAAEGLFRAASLYRKQGLEERAAQLFDRLREQYPDSSWTGRIR